jgi:nucleotide-binding universal stress UspA family protein
MRARDITLLLGHPEPLDVEPVRQRAYETLGEGLAGWQEKYPEVRVTREVVRDHPSRTLLRYAESARLVVVGTRGRGGFRGLLLGSTGQHLLYHAPCPVAIVRTEPDMLG